MSNSMNRLALDSDKYTLVLLQITNKRKVSGCLLVCNEERKKGLLSSLVCILYRVAPSLYSPILGVVWWYFQHCYAIHQRHPVDGGQSHSLCLSQSSLLCAELEDRSSGSSHRPNNNNPKPFHPTPPFPHPFFPTSL